MSPQSNGFCHTGDGTPGPESWSGYTADDTVIIGQPINVLSVRYKSESFIKSKYAFRLLTFNSSNLVTSSIVLKEFNFSSEDAAAGEKQIRLDNPVTLVEGQRIFIGVAEGDIPADGEKIPCGKLNVGNGIGYITINQQYQITPGTVTIGYGYIG